MKKFLLALSFFSVTCLYTMAQGTKISGTVTDAETQEAIAGASVVIKGKLTGTTTDASGKFELSTSAALPLTIVISTVGFQRTEMEVTDANQSLSVNLSSKAELMNEVVFSAS